jgi:hypothetical protein
MRSKRLHVVKQCVRFDHAWYDDIDDNDARVHELLLSRTVRGRSVRLVRNRMLGACYNDIDDNDARVRELLLSRTVRGRSVRLVRNRMLGACYNDIDDDAFLFWVFYIRRLHFFWEPYVLLGRSNVLACNEHIYHFDDYVCMQRV